MRVLPALGAAYQMAEAHLTQQRRRLDRLFPELGGLADQAVLDERVAGHRRHGRSHAGLRHAADLHLGQLLQLVDRGSSAVLRLPLVRCRQPHLAAGREELHALRHAACERGGEREIADPVEEPLQVAVGDEEARLRLQRYDELRPPLVAVRVGCREHHHGGRQGVGARFSAGREPEADPAIGRRSEGALDRLLGGVVVRAADLICGRLDCQTVAGIGEAEHHRSPSCSAADLL